MMQWLFFFLPSFIVPSVYGMVRLQGLQPAADQTYGAAPTGLRAVDPSVGQTGSKLLSGMRVAVIGVHFEGNLGDEMETTPLLKQLYDWGVAVDAYSDKWKPDLSLRLHSRATRPLAYVQSFSATSFENSDAMSGNYDAIIAAPGPCVRPFGACNVSTKIFAFGVSLLSYNSDIECYDFIWTREPFSFNLISPVHYPTASISQRAMLSGDLSHSFEPIPAAVKYWQASYKNLLTSIVRNQGKCIIVVSRSDSVAGVHFDKHVVEMVALQPGAHLEDQRQPKTKVRLPISKVVFASSDPEVDRAHFEELEANGVHKDRLILLESIEQMFGLFTAAEGVQIFSDRYHPAVAGHLLGKNVTVLGAADDSQHDLTKMIGLNALLTNSPAQLKEHNIKSFESLRDHLLKKKRVATKIPDV